MEALNLAVAFAELANHSPVKEWRFGTWKELVSRDRLRVYSPCIQWNMGYLEVEVGAPNVENEPLQVALNFYVSKVDKSTIPTYGSPAPGSLEMRFESPAYRATRESIGGHVFQPLTLVPFSFGELSGDLYPLAMFPMDQGHFSHVCVPFKGKVSQLNYMICQANTNLGASERRQPVYLLFVQTEKVESTLKW